MRFFTSILCLVLFIPVLGMVSLSATAGEAADADTGFAIARYDIIGNTRLKDEDIKHVLKPFTGLNKTSEDVEKARTALEKYYHKQGYPTALVNIPEQTVENDSVQLQVIESKIRRVRITGNRYFTMQSILKKLPSFTPGEILYLPRIQKELADVNSHPDLKVAPVLIPGKVLGTIDVELKVKDKLPLHGSLELNNRNTHDTTDLRLNALVRYDNLWQKEHSVSLQYQTSPQDIEEVNALAASYVLPAPWNDANILAVYSVWSNSDVAFGREFEAIGEGFIVGVRYVIPLPSLEKYHHNLTLGVDYKDFEDKLEFQSGDDAMTTPITYLPLSLSYAPVVMHSSGFTRFNVGLNLTVRGLVTEKKEIEEKRYESRGNYVFVNMGFDHHQPLPWDVNLLLKVQGQVSDQPLPSNEQFVAGGMNSVRGYKESEEAGDNACSANIELSYAKFAEQGGSENKSGLFFETTPYIFFDAAFLSVLNPLSGQEQPDELSGTGVGFRGKMTRFFDYDISWGMTLARTVNTDAGEHIVYFVIRGQF